MNRRDLIKGAAALPLIATTMSARTVAAPKLIKPKRLAPGDTVGIIAPASAATPEAFDRAVASMTSMGFKVKIGNSARGRLGHLSATDKERLADLHWAFSDPEIKAVWCIRGGGGAPRLLGDVDYALIKKNPKIFVGFSDITALHIAISQATGLVTFHGPVASSEYSEYTRSNVLNMLASPKSPLSVGRSEFNNAKESALFRGVEITKGKTRGRLTGGNLSLLAALAGTPYALKDIKGKLLFIEEIGEPPYRVDRLLTQLRQSLDLKSLAGIALGIFDDNSVDNAKDATPVINVLRDRLGDLGIPVYYGLSFGHIRDMITLPYGIEAELDTSAATLTFLETAVS
ncbi:MAG: LD-carboxypeptidase [Blastocatellia bacterium]|nr:LD-carboxypeptidase [Blastocatellia bacterium]